MLAAGVALAVSGSLGASAAPAGSPAAAVAPAGAAADNGITLVHKRHRHRHRGHSNLWWGAPLLAAPFLYDGYGDYGYNSYGYGYRRGNSCYRACRYEHGPRYCRHNWEDYC